MNRRPAQLLAAVTLMAIAGCGVPMQTSPTRLDDHNVHVVGRVPSTGRSGGFPTVRAALCFVSADRLVVIERKLQAPLSARRVVDALVDLARTPLPVGIRSAISAPDIASASNGLRGIAYTNLAGVGQVQFTRDGHPADIPRADGSLTSKPVSRFDYSVLLPAS